MAVPAPASALFMVTALSVSVATGAGTRENGTLSPRIRDSTNCGICSESLGEFATAAALSGRKVNLLGNIIVTQVGSLKWAMASVVGVILTVVMGLVIAGFLRIVDLKREL